MAMVREKTEILLAFGGNLRSPVGPPDATIVAAVDYLQSRSLDLVALSALYGSPAVTLDADTIAPPYVNAAARMRTDLPALEVLKITQETERAFGRQPAARWTARPLDIDLLAYGAVVLPGMAEWQAVASSVDPAAILPEPVVPHPRLHLRGFVLAPLLDIAPDWRHPVLGKAVWQLAQEVRGSGAFDGIEKLAREA